MRLRAHFFLYTGYLICYNRFCRSLCRKIPQDFSPVMLRSMKAMTDTIAAIATAGPRGHRHRAHIRAGDSGRGGRRICRLQRKERRRTAPPPDGVRAHAHGGGAVIDDGLCVIFAPESSYTGEWSAELHCHGSAVVLEEVLRSAFTFGARQARGVNLPGGPFSAGGWISSRRRPWRISSMPRRPSAPKRRPAALGQHKPGRGAGV